MTHVVIAMTVSASNRTFARLGSLTGPIGVTFLVELCAEDSGPPGVPLYDRTLVVAFGVRIRHPNAHDLLEAATGFRGDVDWYRVLAVGFGISLGVVSLRDVRQAMPWNWQWHVAEAVATATATLLALALVRMADRE